jgi:hypothetical protein
MASLTRTLLSRCNTLIIMNAITGGRDYICPSFSTRIIMMTKLVVVVVTIPACCALARRGRIKIALIVASWTRILTLSGCYCTTLIVTNIAITAGMRDYIVPSFLSLKRVVVVLVTLHTCGTLEKRRIIQITIITASMVPRILFGKTFSIWVSSFSE